MLCEQGVESIENIVAKNRAEDVQRRASDLTLAQLLIGQAYFTVSLGNPEKAQLLAEESVRLFRQIKPRPGRQLARSLLWLGEIHLLRGDYANVLKQLDESVAISREIGDKNSQGHAIILIGVAESYAAIIEQGEIFSAMAPGYLRRQATGGLGILPIGSWDRSPGH